MNSFHQQAIDKQVASQQQSGSIAGHGAGLGYGPVSPSAPGDTIGSRIGLACSQASELRTRISGVVSSLIGAVPSNPSKEAQPPSCLMDILDLLSRELQESLNEIERLQGRL